MLAGGSPCGMTVRYIGDGRHFAEIGAPHAYRPGDLVFIRMGESAGEGMFIGRLRSDPDVLVLATGALFVEHDAAHCVRTGHGRPAEGKSWRGAYMKRHPGVLAP